MKAKKNQTLFSEMYSEVMTITPAMAEDMLKRNTANRKVNRCNVMFLKNQLLDDGKWRLNGEAIKIASDGEILDGQHRLIACIESGVPMATVVMHNVPSEAKHTMDTGRNRSSVDVLSFTFRDTKYIDRISGSAKFIIMFNAGKYGASGSTGSAQKGNGADNSDVLDFVKSTEGFIEFVAKSAKMHAVGDKCVLSKVFIGLHWVLSSKYGSAVVDPFFEALSTGANIDTDSPIFVIRRKLIQHKTGKTNAAPLRGGWLVWSLIKIFTYWIEGKKVSKSIVYINSPINF